MQSKAKKKTFKYVIVGDSGVGKTSLLNRFTQGKFDTEILSTIGVDFKSKTVCRQDYVEQVQTTIQGVFEKNNNFVLNIWDTAGQERFNTITRSFYRGAQAIILLFSVNDKETFNRVSKWVNKIMDQGDQQSQRIVYLVGSKADSNRNGLTNVTNYQLVQEQAKQKEITKREVSQAQGQELADKYEISYIQISSKTGYNVEQLFKNVTRQVIESNPKILDDRAPEKIILPDKLIKAKPKRACC